MSLVALVVSIAAMVVYLGTNPNSAAAVVVPFTSMVNCQQALVYVLKQQAVAAAFCVDTSRVPQR